MTGEAYFRLDRRTPELDLTGYRVTEKIIRSIQAVAEILQSLRLPHCVAIDSIFSPINECRTLRHLDLSENRATPAGLRTLCLPQLELLDLGALEVYDEDVEDIVSRMPIAWLGLSGTEVHCRSLRNARHLRHLDLSTVRLREADLEELSPLNLESVDLSATNVSGPGLVHLTGVRALALRNCGDRMRNGFEFHYIARCTRLKSLIIDGLQVVTDDIGFLEPLRELRFLHLERTRWSKTKLHEIRSLLPGCTVVG